MPKQLIPAGWLEKPCRFLCHESSTATCGSCEGEFGLLNGRRHCSFCGHIFHRRQCTRKVHVDGLFFRRRICSKCDYYRNVAAEKLKRGEEFVCAGHRGVPGDTVFISLSEETAELVIRWRATGVTETADLLEVKTRKGFSHRGRLNSVGDYDPLRSISLFVGDSFGGQRSFDIRASSAWSAQLWVDGLTAAHYVYQCMLEQSVASDSITIEDSSRWFNRTLYLPQLHQPQSSSSLPSFTQQPLRSWSSSSTPTEHDMASTRKGLSRSRYLSDRSVTPTPPCKIRSSQSRLLSVDRQPSVSPTSSTPGLPYIHSTFSSICRCHAYEIIPSRSIDLRLSEVERKPSRTTCCRQCRDVCKIVIDMDNL